MSDPVPEIVRRALVDTVVDIGQLSVREKRTLKAYVKRGWLDQGQGGPFPKIKTVYAHKDYDFTRHRRAWVNYMMYLSELDRAKAEQRSNQITGRR